ncbi:MAG: hypothetical protein RIB52_09855 [Erythrobacter sp.]|uniref:hypothetical protein n=1 Tax=Erythrobacter sp. TaxID=1042 RepID=UPI0032EDC326
MKAALSWLARTALLYVLLALAIALAMVAWPRAAGFLEGWEEDAAGPAEVSARIAAARDAAQARLEERERAARTASLDALEARIAAARAQREMRKAALEANESEFLARYRPSRIIARKRAEIELALVENELALLEAAREPRTAYEAARSYLENNPRMPTEAAIAAARRRCMRDRAALEAFEARWEIEQGLREAFRSERSALEAAVRESCPRAQTLADRRMRALDAAAEAGRARGALAALAAEPIPRDIAQGTSRTLLRDIALKALWALLAILLLPPALRVLLYYGLAPLAEKRPPLRFDDPAASPAFLPAGESRVSLALVLGEGEEAIVRQDFLQSSSLKGAKRTRWLLDWSHPIASVASGMRFLTAVGGVGEEVLVSAVKDPLAELALLEIPPGGAAVVRPSALAGLVQRESEPVRISTRWRLFSLPAWLTFQLRYFVFHGPARLVLKGGRGVRIEPARRGRIVGQGQLIGFSTDCAYSVIRTETFWPYFFGREELLKDRIEQGAGVLLVEEAPLAGRSGVGRGIEGAMDAFLKLFGV